jgi:hypothetical protein
MRLTRFAKPFEDSDYLSELKHDGFRAIRLHRRTKCDLDSVLCSRPMTDQRDIRSILLSHITMLNAELDRIWSLTEAIPAGDAKRDELNKIHLELSNIVAVMKADLSNLS